MDELTIPENLDDITTVEAVDEMLASIRAAATELFGAGTPSADDLAILQKYAAATAALEARKNVLAGEAEELASQIAAVIAQLGIANDEDGESDENESGETKDESGDDSNEDDDASDSDSDGEAGTGNQFGGLTVPRKKAVPHTARPKTPTTESSVFMATDGLGHGERLDSPEDIAAAFHSKFNTSAGTRQGDNRVRVLSIAGKSQSRFSTDGSARSTDLAIRRATDAQIETIVAAGPCGPTTPFYDVKICGERGTPIENALPSIDVPRLKLQYTPASSWRDVAAAVDSRDCGDETDKVPYDFDCSPTAEFCAGATYTYATFPNTLQFADPEGLAADIENLLIAYDADKEIGFLDAIGTDSTDVTSGGGFVGAIRTYIADITLAAVAYRRRHRMARNAELTLIVQPELYDLLRTDALQDHAQGLVQANMPDQAIDAIFRARNLSVVQSMDTGTGTDTMDAPQGVGILNPWDCSIVSYLFAPGTFVLGRGQNLNIGYFRDSSLVARNRVGYFAEEWLGIFKPGCESIKLTTSVNMSGAGPLAVDGYSYCA